MRQGHSLSHFRLTVDWGSLQEERKEKKERKGTRAGEEEARHGPAGGFQGASSARLLCTGAGAKTRLHFHTAVTHAHEVRVLREAVKTALETENTWENV